MQKCVNLRIKPTFENVFSDYILIKIIYFILKILFKSMECVSASNIKILIDVIKYTIYIAYYVTSSSSLVQKWKFQKIF